MRSIREFSMNRMRMRGLVSPIMALCIVGLAVAGCGELTGPVSPSTPANVTATLLSGTSTKVTWTPSPQNDGVVSYSVYRNGTKVGESKTTSFTDTGLAQQQTYKYTVAANCTSGVISDQSAVTAASTVTTLDITPPTVASHQPPTGFQGVSPSATATVVFSEPMDPATINTTTFNLKVTSTGALIPGAVTFTAATRTAEFKPTNPMPNPADITATVTTGAKDLAGNGLAAAFAWGFTTRDDTPPTVLSTTPVNGATAPPSVIFLVSFSEAMDASTITAANITLKVTSSGAAVAGNVNYNTTTHNASFTPNQTLVQNTGYTLTISGAVKDAAGNQMGTAVTVAITTTDVTPPTVVSTVPADGAIGVSPTAPITATFSEPMDLNSISATTFTLKTTSGLTPVTGTVTYNTANNTATFTPTPALSGVSGYTATITTGAKDVSANALVADKVWTFTTGDVTAPTVVSVSPANGASGVSATTTVQVTFSEPMAAATINTTNISLKNTATSATIPASVSYSGNVATLTPASPLSGGTQYTITVTTGATDAAGNPLASPFTSNFTVESTPPTVLSVSPPDGATNVATNTAVQVAFSEPMDQATINGTTISLKNTSTSAVLAATVVYNVGTNSATLTPSGPLSNSTQYTVTVTTGVKDVAGNAMTTQFTSKFTTVPIPDTTPPTIILRNPAPNDTGVVITVAPKVGFSEAMDQTTINSTNIRLVDSLGVTVAANVSYAAATNTATITPTAPLNNSRSTALSSRRA